MNKSELLKNIHSSSRSNLFSIEIPKAAKEDERIIDGLLRELVQDGKIKLREVVQRDCSVYLSGIIKYATK
jgi:hypothetical protein